MPSTTVTTSPLTDSSAKKKPPELVLISGGDPAGIAPEVVRKALSRLQLTKSSVLYLYNAGHADNGDAEYQRLRSAVPHHLHRIANVHERHDLRHRAGVQGQPDAPAPQAPQGLSELIRLAETLRKNADGGVHVVPILADGEEPCLAGKPTALSGLLSFRALDLACEILGRLANAVLVTAPLSKEWVMRGGQAQFSGHTGYLASRFQRKVLMLMHGRRFSVIPLTEHVALADVPAKLRSVLSQAELPTMLAELARRSVFAGSSMALCGLNPHCGEGGLIGNEEQEVLGPFIEKVRAAGGSIQGPLPADTLFMEPVRQQFRLILSCYHDQGLIPFKALEAERGINVTIGLPFLRTSPDHGTAYDRAGSERADATSMLCALEAAISSELTIDS